MPNKAPTQGSEPAKHWSRRLLIGSAGAVAALFIIMAIAGIDYNNRQREIAEAAACNGSLTADQLEAGAQAVARNGNESVRQAEDSAIAIACPRMAK